MENREIEVRGYQVCILTWLFRMEVINGASRDGNFLAVIWTPLLRDSRGYCEIVFISKTASGRILPLRE